MKAALSGWFNARIALVAVLAVLAAGTGGYLKGAKDTRNSYKAMELRDAELYSKMVQATAEEISKIKIVNKTIRQELEREIQVRTEYRDCRHPDSVKRLLDAILTGEEPGESIIGAELPYVDGPD